MSMNNTCKKQKNKLKTSEKPHQQNKKLKIFVVYFNHFLCMYVQHITVNLQKGTYDEFKYV